MSTSSKLKTVLRNKKIVVPAGIILVVLVFVFLRRHKDETIRPAYETIVESVYASGTVQPDSQYTLYAYCDGYLDRSFITEGNMVKKNQVLFKLDNGVQRAQVQSAEANFNYAKINVGSSSPVLAQLSARLNSALLIMENDSIDAERYTRLYKDRAVSEVDYEQAILNYKTAIANYENAYADYNNTKNQVELNFQNAKSQNEVNSLSNQYYFLSAKADGEVYSILKQNGELTKKGDPVAVLGKFGPPVLELLVDDVDIYKIKLGQEVLVKVEAFGDKILKASVTKIYPMFDTQDQSYKVEAKFTDDFPMHEVGSQVEANIIISTHDHALVIPRTYIDANNEVLVKKGLGNEKIKVQIGVATDDAVEIISGIDSTSILMKQY